MLGRSVWPGDLVQWKGTTGRPMTGRLVGFTKGRKPIVRRWIQSNKKYGSPQVVDSVEPVEAGDEL